MNKKYTLLKSDTITVFGKTLFRIKAKIAFGAVDKGEKGGYIEREANLQVYGDAWVYGDARVYGNALVYGDAWGCGNARVYGNAWVYGNARVSGDAWVSGDARVSGDAWVSGDALVYGNARVYGNALVYDNARVYGDAWVYGDARVYGNAQVSVKVFNLIFCCEFSCSAYQQKDIGLSVQIGCKLHSVKEWKKIFKNEVYLNLCKNKDEYKKCEMAFKYVVKIAS